MKTCHVDIISWNPKDLCYGRSFTGNFLQFFCKYLWTLKSSKPKKNFHFTWTYFLLSNYLPVRSLLSLLFKVGFARELETQVLATACTISGISQGQGTIATVPIVPIWHPGARYILWRQRKLTPEVSQPILYPSAFLQRQRRINAYFLGVF